MMFGKYFVKTQRVNERLGAIFNNLMENRVEADYALQSNFTEEEIEKILDQTKELLTGVRSILSDQIDNLPRLKT